MRSLAANNNIMLKKIKSAAVILFIVPIIVGFGQISNNAESVSLINLIGAPDKYNGKIVRVIGVTNIQFEGNSIYLNREHLINGVTKNALWLSLNCEAIGKSEDELSQNNGKYGLVEGVFKHRAHGHMGVFSGTIDNVTRFMPWPPKDVKEKIKKGLSP